MNKNTTVWECNCNNNSRWTH